MATEDTNPEGQLFVPIGIRTVRSAEVNKRDESPNGVTERLLAKPTVIHLFTDGPDRVFDPDQFVQYLGKTFGSNFIVQNEGDLMQYVISHNPEERQKIISSVASAKLAKRGWYSNLSDEEKIRLEEEATDREVGLPFREFARSQALERRSNYSGDIVQHNDYYEISSLGFAFNTILSEYFTNSPDKDKRHSILVITGRGIGNQEQGGIHMRGGFTFGNMAVVSTTGLVEAPGKPLELERAIQAGRQLGGGLPMFDRPEYAQKIHEVLRQNGNVLDHKVIEQAVQEIFEDRMLHYEDSRLNEAVKGISLSMLFSTLGEWGKASQCSTTELAAGEPDLSRTCRMHDAHWQEELIATQIKTPEKAEFCDYHTEIFKKLQANT